jgi:hypothetical protein
LARVGRVSVGQRFGSWTVSSGGLFTKNNALYVVARCDCGFEQEANLRFLETGRSTRCKSCASRSRHREAGHHINASPTDRILQKRVNAWFQRCNNPKDQSYHNYGGRGIECRFASVKDAVEWVKANLPHPTYKALDIDREDNNKHYAPGNLRLITRKANLLNKRGANHIMWQGQFIPTQEWVSPYSLGCTMRYAAMGLSGEEIIMLARRAVEDRRKGWRKIQEKLTSMTLSTAAREVGSLPTGG